VYLNWSGTDGEFQRVKAIVREQVGKTAGIELTGLYIPTNKWNYVVVYEIDTFENFLSFQKEVRVQLKNQNLDKISTRKLVILIKEKSLC
jgi:hypothetical protein